MATPFVEGRLRKEYVSVEVETKCQDCGAGMHINLDSEMKVSVREPGATPLVFMPDIDWEHFTEPTIIDAY
jgi:hypothetical protein